MESQPPAHRIASIDILRGLIMIIMALDHVRDFFHDKAILEDPLNLATTTPALFLTRWVTHFCAPVFVFLAGLSASIVAQRKTKRELSNFLLARGLWLVVAEVFIMTLVLTFNPSYNLFLLLVLWAIGWSMVILGLLVRTSNTVIAAVAVVLFFGHNVTDLLTLPSEGPLAAVFNILITTSGSFYTLSAGHSVVVAYAILPWTGIMLLGYLVGAFYKKDSDERSRRKNLLLCGSVLLILFVMLRLVNQYGDPNPWSVQESRLKTFLSFINVTKYPVSLQFACVTLGPALMALAWTENFHNRFTRFVYVYGKVPFFYYIGHFLLAHVLCVIAFFAMGYSLNEAADLNSPFLFRPSTFGFSLAGTYAIWLLVVLLMYFPCRWFGRYKQTHKQWWLSYL